jgi:predicted nucleic acid-binding protein
MFLLDANVVSELRKLKRGHVDKGVAEWAEGVPLALMFLSIVSVHEMEYGVLQAERRDPAKGGLLREWLDGSVLPTFADRIMLVDLPVALQAATFHVPDPVPFKDALVGATAMVHGMTIVTRNVVDFERFDGLEVLNPWA